MYSGRQAPVDDNGLDECIRFHLEYMNYEVNSDEVFQVTLKTLDVFDPDFFKRISNRQFTFWLINTGVHWASIVLHVEDGQVVHYAINEPGKNPVLINIVDNRLRQLLTIGGIAILPASYQIKDVWFPTQLDGFSCGLRTYEILRVMIERVNERYHLHGVVNLYDESLWDAMSGDFQPSKVRQLMMGIVACRAMKHQDYKARLSVTPREKIRGFKGPRPLRQGVVQGDLRPMRTKIWKMFAIYQGRNQREQRVRQRLVRTSDFRVFHYCWNGDTAVYI
ncbi:hypothetical protein INS49_015303 [Diaporthe citri]|uniref:uncharacterized protein n=1 Tax=Diaporthe citri TaxID=83186 RepID=UPI001C7FFC4E|nr:uncharacterized protein INS49_015303 [Diaporthe citri]KAG6355919.1 hypothetical protein INS49_015303 [Diaporthe citri]